VLSSGTHWPSVVLIRIGSDGSAFTYGPYQSPHHSSTLPCMSSRPHALGGPLPTVRGTTSPLRLRLDGNQLIRTFLWNSLGSFSPVW